MSTWLTQPLPTLKISSMEDKFQVIKYFSVLTGETPIQEIAKEFDPHLPLDTNTSTRKKAENWSKWFQNQKKKKK